MTTETMPCHRSEQTAMGPATAYRILVVASDPSREQDLRRYAEALALPISAEIAVLRGYGRANLPAGPSGAVLHGHVRPLISASRGLAERIRQVARARPFNLLVADWPVMDQGIGVFARLVEDTGVTTLLVRHRNTAIRRVIVPTGGGAHALEGVRIADALARSWSLKARVLRIVRPEPDSWGRLSDLKRWCRHIQGETRLYLDVADAEMPVQVRLGGDVAGEIICRCRPDDLIVIGGSGQWLMQSHASESIPCCVAEGARGPVAMVLTGQDRPTSLADVFWDRTVCVGLQAENKRAAIETLVDALVNARQVPTARREEVVEIVMQREHVVPTYMGQGVAIPHAAIRGFRGLVGVLGVFPGGVPFGKTGSDRARFLFLLLTPKESYEVYLPTLARIAEFMSRPDWRQGLAEAESPSQVVALMAEAEKQWSGRNTQGE